MRAEPSRFRVEVVGREAELAALRAFLAPAAAARALVVEGGPGIGKTTLWECAVGIARQHGRVLTARPGDGEAHRSFAALADLFDGVALEAIGLPAPQRLALEAALLRATPPDAPPEPRAIVQGVLGALRSLAPLLVAIDDVQWLDAASAEALAFAARRLEDAPVTFLLAGRSGHRRSALEQVLARGAVEPLAVGPLTLEETRRLLAGRLDLRLPRPLLRRVAELTLGNPLFALEIGRALAAGGRPRTGEAIPLPSAVEELLGARVGALASEPRRVLLAAALDDTLWLAELVALCGREAVDAALDAELLVTDGAGRVRPSHPLLGAAARQQAGRAERRALHLALSGVVADDELAVWHLSFATDDPDAELARMVAAAAVAAASRGAAQDAVELAEHALRLTPRGDAARPERVLALGGFLERTGDRRRVTDLLTAELDALPPGRARARAWLLLSEGGAIETYGDHDRHLARALAESDDPESRATALAMRALCTAAEGVERIPHAEAWALEALPREPGAEPALERHALRALAWTRALAGRPIDDVCARFHVASEATAPLMDSPDPVAALRLVWRGELGAARAALTRHLRLADERGEALAYAWLRLNLCELGLREGAWDDVAQRLDEWAESDDDALLITPTYQRCRALVAAGRGEADEAVRWAAPALEQARARGYRWQVLEAQRALGVAALLGHEPAAAVTHLRAVWEHTEREGVEEPGAFPVAPDLVEALVATGELDTARAVAGRLRDLAGQQDHPWARPTARRCDAVIRLAGAADDDRAAAALATAADDLAGLRLGFDAARARLDLGRAQRRARRWSAARASLSAAADGFEAIGSRGWAALARSELGRVGARRPSPAGELTPAERGVAEQAAAGHSNQEIARALHVSVRTVEAHLTRVYAKLGVRSRSQLAGRLAAAGDVS